MGWRLDGCAGRSGGPGSAHGGLDGGVYIGCGLRARGDYNDYEQNEEQE